MSTPSKAELVREALKKYSNIEEMKAKTQEIAESCTCSRSLVYKEINRLAETMSKEILPQAKEPVIKIEKPEEIEMPTEEEEKPTEEEGEVSEEEIPLEEEGPKEEEEKEKPEVSITPKMVKILFEKPFEIASRLSGCEDIQLTTKESDQLADAWLPYLESHLPEVLAENFPLVYAGYVTITVVGTKAIVYKQWKDRQTPKKEEREYSPETPPTSELPKSSVEESPDLEKKPATKPAFLRNI